MTKIQGLLPAALTPMTSNGNVNSDAVPLQANYFKQAGAAGVFINGTTAEWASMTVSERMGQTSAWAEHNDPDFTLIDHVGHHCQHEAVELAKHARASGVDGIAVIAPSYYQLTTAQDVLDWCRPIAEAAGELPFYYYDLPQFTRITVPAFDAIELLADEISTFAGIKYSGTDPAGLQRCVDLHDRKYTVFFGSDENLIMGLAMGCEAGVGSTYNLALPHYLKVIAAFENGDMARARSLQKEALDWVEIMVSYGVIPSLKALQPLVGFEVGVCRLPFRTLSDSEAEELRSKVTGSGILNA